jgi:uncharacterized damage-inducible protein DinB
MSTTFQPLNFAPHWQTMNENLIELIDLVPDDKLDWSPREGEWAIKTILVHIILARYHHVLIDGVDGATVSEIVASAGTKVGLQKALASSWEGIARFISDPAKLNTVYAPPGNDPMYLDPELYDGHYIAYHRFAHDLHHRSTIIGCLNELGVSLDGRRVRPL